MKDNQGYPSILQELFPGHPAKRLLCTGVQHKEDGSKKKNVVTIRRGAQLQDYSKHLDSKSFDGAGALGINPTCSRNSGERTRWFVWFLVLDFDNVELADIRPLIDVLEEYRIYVYLDQGTTGRGVHLYIFLNEVLFQMEAHTALITIANLSKRLGLPYPEFMPSSPSGTSKGIFLPYRGAAEDGFGANPLIDPVGGMQIPLDAVEDEVYRTEVGDLKALVDSLGKVESETKDSDSSSYNPININTYSGALKAWDGEMTRLKELWIETKRQYLTLGLAAYGISLGIYADKIRDDIIALESSSSHPEVNDRLKAVDGTIEKYVKGERVAWRKFYNLAGVEPPGANRVVAWEVLLKLQILEDKLCSSVPFKGMGGFTDLDVLDSLIEVGKKYGRQHSKGVEVSISTRDLALVARTSRETIINSLKRLREAEWVDRTSYGEGTNSGSVVLLVDNEDVVSHDLVDEDDEEITVHIPRFRWGGGKLGKTVRPILQNLQRLQPCTRAEVARAMGRKSRDIRDPMNRLWEYRLVEYDENTNTYSLPSNFEDRLWDVLLDNGTWQTDLKHEKRFKRERNLFKALFSLKADENKNSYEKV